MDPLLIDIPESFDSDRLTIRAPRAGEGVEVNAAVLESIEELQRWMPWATPVPTVENTEAYTRQARAKFIAREELAMRFFLKASGEFVGASGLMVRGWDVPAFEIGYWVRRRFAGQGYVTEAVRAIAAMAFEVLHAERLVIRCDDQNERSWRVAERCGFVLEGLHRRDSRTPGGELRDTRLYARLRDIAVR
jgi:RimJ/RimL family protein N-acetyltransferase